MNENSPLQKNVNNIAGSNPVGVDASKKNIPIQNIINPTNGGVPFVATDEHKLPPNTIIRTFEGDLAEAMARGKTSYAKIAIAQNRNEKGEEIIKNITEDVEPSKSHILRNIIFIFVGIVLLAGGGYGGYYLFSKSTLFHSYTSAPITNQDKPKSILPNDGKIEFDISNQSKLIDRLKALVLSQNKPNTIIQIDPVIRTGDVTKSASLEQLKKAFDLYVPDQLNRSLTGDYMIGVYVDSNSISSVFVAVKNNYFQNAFSGIVSWEDVLPNDISIFLSSTSRAVKGRFVDKIVKNRDVRSFANEEKQTLFVYSFINRDLLLFAKNEVILSAIVTRLDTNTFSR
jgi:hypothetical protein